ncbi:hypothetical protein ACJO73_07080 [Citrobacter freundii]|uniref:hypothetical protein n=1 Tax=Citrobacter freundii TaxID=546 RepID=UPI003ED96185
MKFKSIYTVLILIASCLPLMATASLTEHQLLVSCNKKASYLVESFDGDLQSLKESRRLDLLRLVSDGCQGGYKSARDGMQYKDIERYLTQESSNSELPIDLMLESVKAGYSIYNNGN